MAAPSSLANWRVAVVSSTCKPRSRNNKLVTLHASPSSSSFLLTAKPIFCKSTSPTRRGLHLQQQQRSSKQFGSKRGTPLYSRLRNEGDGLWFRRKRRWKELDGKASEQFLRSGFRNEEGGFTIARASPWTASALSSALDSHGSSFRTSEERLSVSNFPTNFSEEVYGSDPPNDKSGNAKGRRWQQQQRRRWSVCAVETSGSGSGSGSSGSGTNAGREQRISAVGTRTSGSARERRLQKAAEEKRRKAEGAQPKYPEWASILEDACKDDVELREIIGDSFGNPEEMRRRVEERVRRKGRDVLSPKTGSAVPMTVTFKLDFDATDTFLWLELYGEPSDGDMETIGNVLTSWYMLGKLGAFNSMNMQLTDLPIDAKLSYSTDRANEALPSMFHNITDLEFQDNWGRVWLDLGTSDPVAMDALINGLAGVSSDHIGIKQLVFGGQKLGDWEEGMIDPEYGYKKFKI